MAIVDKLTYLNTTKTLLREAITRAGHYLTEADPFREYPYALLKDEHSLQLDFLRGEYVAKNWRDGTVSRVGFGSIISFTRGSGGGRFNHLGAYEWVGNNVARIDHDPATVDTSTSSVTIGAGLKTFDVSRLYPVGQYVRATADASNWVSGRVVASTGTSVTLWVDKVAGTGTFTSWTLIRVLGMLVEEGRTNLLTYSGDLSQWVIARLTQSSSGGGTLLTETTESGGHACLRFMGFTSGTAYTFTVELKSSSNRYVRVLFPAAAFSSQIGAFFDLATGTVVGATSPGVTASIKPTGGGKYACSITATATTTAPGNSDFRLSLTNFNTVYEGDGVSSIVYYHAQLEAGSFPASHIPTTSSQVTRAADLATVADATDWRSLEGTFLLEHNAPATRQILSSGSNLLMTSQGTGKIAVSFTASGSLVCYNGGTPVAGPALTFDAALKLLGGAATFANAHARRLDFIPRALTGADFQRLTS